MKLMHIILFLVAAVALLIAVILIVEVSTNAEEIIKISGIIATFIASVITGSIALSVASRQRKTTLDVEYIKRRFEGEQNAYLQLLSPCYVYYYTLQLLGRGSYALDALQAADRGMISACGQLAYLGEEQRNEWLRFWQRARKIAGEASDCQSNECYRELWKNSVKEFGQLLENVRELAASGL